MSILSDLYNSLFGKNSVSSDNRAIVPRGNNIKKNLVFNDTVNYDFLTGLYYNTVSGYKLGAFLCHSAISTPLCFMGIPHYDVADWNKVTNKKFWKDQFKYYNENFMNIKTQIQLLCHLVGTIGVYPWFNSKTGYVELYFIKPKYITKILSDINTKEVTGIIETIEYEFYDDNNVLRSFTEETKYTKTIITKTRKGNIPNGIRYEEIRRNPINSLPIFFTNDREHGEFEGHSEIEKIVPIVKAYSEINVTAHENVMNIKPKTVQAVNDYKEWKKANQITDISDFSLENVDLILNQAPDEKTEMLIANNLIENFRELMHIDFWSIIESTGIPEICWGLQMVGNAASPQVQIKVFLSYIDKKQLQSNNPHMELQKNIWKLIGIAYNQKPPDNSLLIWNSLDPLTDVERSQVFSSYASGLQSLVNSNSIDLESIHLLLKKMLGDIITEDFKDFKSKIEEYGIFRSFLDDQYMNQRGFEDTTNDTE